MDLSQTPLPDNPVIVGGDETSKEQSLPPYPLSQLQFPLQNIFLSLLFLLFRFFFCIPQELTYWIMFTFRTNASIAAIIWTQVYDKSGHVLVFTLKRGVQ